MKSIIIYTSDFYKVVPWYLYLNPFSNYSVDLLILGHYGKLEYGYDKIDDLPVRYRKLVKEK